jgi:hypothetical protein
MPLPQPCRVLELRVRSGIRPHRHNGVGQGASHRSGAWVAAVLLGGKVLENRNITNGPISFAEAELLARTYFRWLLELKASN